MRRPLYVLLITTCALASLFMLMATFSTTPVTAYQQEASISKAEEADRPAADSEQKSIHADTYIEPVVDQTVPELAAAEKATSYLPDLSFIVTAATEPFLQLAVNYAEEWVAGSTISETAVAITIADSGGSVKASSTVVSDIDGNFFAGCDDWSPAGCPDIAPGDLVTGTNGLITSTVSPVGAITGLLDAAENTVSGIVNAAWVSDTVNVSCEIWVMDGPEPVRTTAVADGGSFTCDFDNVGWDLAPLQRVAVMYFEEDGDRVINNLLWNWMRVNYGHDWAGGDYPAGHTFWLTNTTALGEVKAVTTIGSIPDGGWYGPGFETPGENWDPGQPDILAGDKVYFGSDDAYSNMVDVGLITITVDYPGDAVSGAISAPWLSPETVTVRCEIWEDNGPESIEVANVDPSGGSYSCDFSSVWDIQPGQTVAVMYVEPDGDTVINTYQGPDMSAWKWVDDSDQVAPGGAIFFNIGYRNEGDVVAETVILTDSWPADVSYLADNSGFSTVVDSETITWTFGPVHPGEEGNFQLVLLNNASDGTLVNEVGIYTDGDFNPDNNRGNAEVTVVDEAPDLYADKYSNPNNPAPGQTYLYQINYGNNGPVPSGPVLLTDTLPTGTTIVGVFSENGFPFWNNISTPEQLILEAPGLPGGPWGDRLYLRLLVDGGIETGTQLINTITITTANEANPDDNQREHGDTWVSEPQWNVGIDKSFNSGVLVPGGNVNYHLHVSNNGNMAASIWVTDVLPAGTTFGEAWTWSGVDTIPFPPNVMEPDEIGWDIGLLEPGAWFDFDFYLAIDGDFPAPDVSMNCAIVTADGPDNNPDDNVSCRSDLLSTAGPNLRVEKVHQWEGENDRLHYWVDFANIGSEPIFGFWITDTMPMSTTYYNEWQPNFDGNRIADYSYTDDSLMWNISDLQPGEAGQFEYWVGLDEPGVPLRWFVNNVAITIPPGDVNPADNSYEDTAFSGGEVRRVELSVGTDNSNVWGEAIPNSVVTVTTVHAQSIGWADAGCGGCWNIDNAGPIYPGDTITVEAASGVQPVIIEVPSPFTAEADSRTDLVTGQIDHLDSEPLEVGLENGPVVYTQTDGEGFYSVLFDDIPRGGQGEVRYHTEIDFAQVTYHRGFRSADLFLTVNYGHVWIGGSSEPNSTVTITLTNRNFSPKVETVVATGGNGDFWTGCEDWGLPECPVIQEFDWVLGSAENGFTTTVFVGRIYDDIDVDADTISGTVYANWIEEPLNGRCEVLSAGGPSREFTVDSDGGQYLCDFTSDWDILPGQDVGVGYQTLDGNWVYNVFKAPAPHIRINKSSYGAPGEGNNFVYQIQYFNDGAALAENVVITDTMQGMVYIEDTSGVPVVTSTVPGGEQVVWQLGTVPRNSQNSFDIFVRLAAAESEAITNSVTISTSSIFNQSSPEERFAEWNGQVGAGATDLRVDKWAWTEDPAVGNSVIFGINVCNDLNIDSAEVVLTDTLHPSMTYQSIFPEQAGWTEVFSSSQQMAATIPSIPGGHCYQVNLRAQLMASASTGQLITNTVRISSVDDVTPENDEWTWEGNVGESHANLLIEKQWNRGQLVPGGDLHYNISFNNNGNIPVPGPIVITDTFPISATFESAWRQNDFGQVPFNPVYIDASQAVWNILPDGLENGFSEQFEIVLRLDQNAIPGTILTNTVMISPSPDEDRYDDNVSSWVEELNNLGPNLRVRKHGGWHGFGEGHNAWFQIDVENIGDVPIGNVVVTDTYPAAMIIDGDIGSNYPRTWDWVDDGASNSFTVTFESLNPGQRTNIDFNTFIDAPGPVPPGLTFVNTATVMTVPGEPGDDNIDNALLTTGPDLSVAKDYIGGIPLPGQLVTFSLRFANERYGHEYAWSMQENAVLTDTLPVGLTYYTSTLRFCGTEAWCPIEPWSYDETQVIWQLWPINAGEWNEILLTLRISDTAEAGDILVDWAEIGSSYPDVDVDPDGSNNSDSASVTVAFPSFELAKIYESSSVAGTLVTYTVSVTNVGSGPGINVVVVDTLPGGLLFVDSDGTFDGSAVSWTYDHLPADGGRGSGWFVATLPCTDTFGVVNDDYGVASSLGGVTAQGPGVNFNVIAPTITTLFNHTSEPIVVGSTVYFTGSATTDGPSLASYTWDFGDSSGASGQTTAHTYTSDDTFTVSFTATDGCGYSDDSSAGLVIDPPEILASFDQSESVIPVSSSLQFTDSSTTNGPPIAAWLWDFGDGTAQSTAQNPSHLYADHGTFTVTLMVTDTYGYSGSIAVINAVTTIAPVFEITKGYESSEVAQTVVTYTLTFTNTGDDTGRGLVITDLVPGNVTWLDGGGYDGNTGVVSWTHESLAVDQATSVTFSGRLACAGEVDNDTYLVASSEVSSPVGPTVAFTIVEPTIVIGLDNSSGPIAGDSVQFTATVNSNGPTITTYEWDFGDGSSGTGLNASHVYAEGGNYTVVFTATDNCAYQATDTIGLSVSAPAIVASFDQSDDVVPILSSVNFTDTSTTDGATIVAWLWDFGDGTPQSTIQNPSHVYTGHGAFTVTLTVTDSYGYGDSTIVVDAVTTLAPVYDVLKSYNSTEIAGTPVTYTLTVTNDGSYTGTNLLIEDELPSDLSWVSGGAYDPGTEVISWTVDSLAVSEQASVQFVGELACNGNSAVNAVYGVTASDQGITSGPVPAISFDIKEPIIDANFDYSGDPIAGASVIFTGSISTNGSTIVSYQWAFGDGSLESGVTAAHVYTQDGEYDVTLVVTDTCGFGDSYSETILVERPNLVASFVQSENVVPINSSVQFTDTSTTDGAAIGQWSWDFGDGSSFSTLRNPDHKYAAHGTFTVTLMVTDEMGYTDTHQLTNAVTTFSPILTIDKEYESDEIAQAPITYTLTVTNNGDSVATGVIITDRVPDNVTWVSGGSYDPVTRIVSWTVESIAAGISKNVQFTGELACSGQVVNDRYRVSASDQGISSPWGEPVSFTIQAPTIEVNFSQSAGVIDPYEAVVFTDTSTTNGPSLTGFMWDFGDGQMSSGPLASHVYTGTGFYTVTLTVTDSCSYEAIKIVPDAVEVKPFGVFLPIVMK